MKRLATKYCLRALIAVLNAAAMSCGAQSSAADPSPLALEAKISLGSVHERIDHLAVDVDWQRLHVAELGNHSVAVVDLKAHVIVLTLTNIAEPQCIGYVHSTDTVYVANAADDGGALAVIDPVMRKKIQDIPNGVSVVKDGHLEERVYPGRAARTPISSQMRTKSR